MIQVFCRKKKLSHHKLQPFPLKRYFLIYGGILTVFFYSLLIFFTLDLNQKSLWEQHIQVAKQKVGFIYEDIRLDFLAERNLTLATIDSKNIGLRQELREKISEIMESFPNLARLKLFNPAGMVLYNHTDPLSEGEIYDDIGDETFQNALKGVVGFEVALASGGERLMEIYFPLRLQAQDLWRGLLKFTKKRLVLGLSCTGRF